ncbi:hypothetical protein ACPPVV_11650 [Rhodanobacter sp. Col0626]|uniref:hypothetical protein n=1 Tax=Rhodanobacter sp. Col0626 TaxID=3415679 RepID=UPI003CE82A04
MTQTIDPVKLKAAAEHLEWVLRKYPDSEEVQDLLHSLSPLIEDAKAGNILIPVERRVIPGAYNFGDCAYIDYDDPNIEDAYYEFSAEMRGGRSEDEKQLIADTEAMRAGAKSHE